jgi:hypothetical protein
MKLFLRLMKKKGRPKKYMSKMKKEKKVCRKK